MSLPKVSFAKVSPVDYLSVAELTEVAFAYDDIGVVAFGFKRATPEGYERRSKKMAMPPPPGEKKYELKAVITSSDGSEQIVGFASWMICTGRSGSEEEKQRLGTREGWKEQDKEEKGEIKDVKMAVAEGHGNPIFRRDVMGGIDKSMARSTEGKDYMILTLLIVDPNHHRRGIGAMLFEDGLKIADEQGLQVITGASSKGVGLYKKYGCVEIATVTIKLWEHEGGEGLGTSIQYVLRRPPHPST